jgi:hypothetical protein
LLNLSVIQLIKNYGTTMLARGRVKPAGEGKEGEKTGEKGVKVHPEP